MTEDSLRLIPDLDGIVCEVLREHLDVTQCPKGHCWVTPWENHCRKVIELYPLKGTSYPVFWGLNFDFLPWESCMLGVNPKPFNVTGKLVYHRTEKAVKRDLRGDVFPYIHYHFMAPSLHTYEEHRAFRSKYFVNAYGADTPENRKQIEDAVRNNMPYMLDWFGRMRTEEDMILALTEEIREAQEKHALPFGAYWVRGFLKAKQHDMAGAVSDLAWVYQQFDPPSPIPEKTMRKLIEIDRM